MLELYWITRLDAFTTATGAISLLAVVIFVLFLLWVIIDDEEVSRTSKRGCWISAAIALVFGLITMFTPGTKDALMIYGIGGTVEYLKKNDEAKGLPDKCIKALDTFLDEYSKENNNK